MAAICCCALSTAALVWPSSSASLLLRAGPTGSAAAWLSKWKSGRAAAVAPYLALLTVPVAAGWSTRSIAVAIAALLVLATGVLLVSRQLRTRRRLRRLTRHRDVLLALKGQLAAGASLERALTQESANGSTEADLLSRILTGPAVREPTGGRPDDVTHRHIATAAAVDMSRQLGIPLTGILDRLARTAEAELTLAAQHSAATAGARVSAAVLTALPVLGVLLGAGMGANPLPVLIGSSLGGALLVGGITLTCAGLLWSARLTGLNPR